MSNVKRFYAADDFTGEICVLATDYDTALSQLAALREELANQRDHGDEREAEMVGLQQRLADAERRNEILIEDRARFPDRPDFVGQMIGSHIGNLKAAKKSSEDYARSYILKNDILSRKNSELTEALEDLLKGAGTSPGANKKYAKARAALNKPEEAKS